MAELAHSFAWTQGYVTAAGWLDWLAALPLEQRAELPGSVRLLGTHVAPGQIDGEGLHPRLSDNKLATLVSGGGADVVCVGHTHQAMHRTVGGVRVINVGSVSNPYGTDLRACYVIVEASDSGCEFEHRRVAYDYDGVVEAVRRSKHPAGDYIVNHFVR